MISMFAIPNCDTVKKARAFLEKNNIAYEFINFKQLAPTKTQIIEWSDHFGELPVNKKGSTYRKNKDYYESLSASDKITYIIANPSLIKRPVLIKEGQIFALGFNEERYQELLA